MVGHTLSRPCRIRKRQEFQRVFAARVRVSDNTLVIAAATNEFAHPRLGLAVSRRVGNAVVRNRWKRLIRESFRQTADRLPAGIDLVIMPRQGAEPSLSTIQASLAKLTGHVVRKLWPRAPGGQAPDPR